MVKIKKREKVKKGGKSEEYIQRKTEATRKTLKRKKNGRKKEREKKKNGKKKKYVIYEVYNCLFQYRPTFKTLEFVCVHWERILKTIKELNNFIWTNRKVETKLYLLPICPNRIF